MARAIRDRFSVYCVLTIRQSPVPYEDRTMRYGFLRLGKMNNFCKSTIGSDPR
jgi:hypothetical protein